MDTLWLRVAVVMCSIGVTLQCTAGGGGGGGGADPMAALLGAGGGAGGGMGLYEFTFASNSNVCE